MQIMVSVPDGKKGAWEVGSFIVSKQDENLHNLRCQLNGHQSRMIEAGKYKRLMRDGQTIMSNTPAEINDHIEFFRQAKKRGGDILINGLGLGVAVTELLSYDNVKTVTVIELDKDVIALTGPTFAHNKRVTIINADAYKYKPAKGVNFTCIWHDIWDDINTDNLKEMTRLVRKYQQKCQWHGSWAKDECLVQKRREKVGYW